MDLGLAGRTALVTGASRGIGRAVAIRFAREGANLVVCARGEAPLLALATELEQLGAQVVTVACDVTDPDAPASVLERAAERFPGIDILVNNAGRADPKKLLETTDADWSEGFELNLLSAVRFTRACLPGMVESGWGRIINVSSTTARMADPYYAIYGATKAALINFTKTVSTGFATSGVRCTCVLPGITRTELVDELIDRATVATGASADEVMERMLRKWPIPVGRLGEPSEVADAIVFLASANADWITGVALPVDGGTIPTAS